MDNKKTVPLLKKVSVTLLCILGSAGIIYFFEAFKNLNSGKSSEILWLVIFGISFAYLLNYKLEITNGFFWRNKSQDEKK